MMVRTGLDLAKKTPVLVMIKNVRTGLDLKMMTIVRTGLHLRFIMIGIGLDFKMVHLRKDASADCGERVCHGQSEAGGPRGPVI